MKTPEFQPDRSDALRKQLEALPAPEVRGEPQPSRRVLLALGAAGFGGVVLFGASWLAGRAPDPRVEQARPAAPSGPSQQADPTQQGGLSQTVMPDPNDAYAAIPRSEIQGIGAIVDTLWNATDPYYGYNTVPDVARVHVDSIEGGRVFSPIFAEYVYPQTVGKMTVREVYKGSLKRGTQQNYARNGAIVSYGQYWHTLNPAQQEKILHLNNGRRPTEPKYVHAASIGNVDIEVARSTWSSSGRSRPDGTFHEYAIDGFQFGLREVKGSGDDTAVLNIETRKWESLSGIVKLD